MNFVEPPPIPTSPPTPAPGSRRRRIWELDGHAHCPVVGACLPVALMRKLVAKVVGGDVIGSDYELHCGVITDCKTRTRLAELVQRTLDQRFASALRESAACKTSEALALWWRQNAQGAELPSVLWAVITHARCLPVIEQFVLGELHMLQHQVGHADRIDHTRLADLQRELAQAQASADTARRRMVAQAEEHATERERLASETVRLRGQLLSREALLLQLQQSLDALRAAAPDLPARLALEQRLREQVERAQGLQRALNQAQSLHAAAAAPAAPAVAMAAINAAASPQKTPLPTHLCAHLSTHLSAQPPAQPPGHLYADKTVLCVGGRTATVPVYRRLIEATGARFLHHDGGAEDNVQRLESTLNAAELVICQTGCISHDAYWRVKEHCKRHGKRCVFVDKPSAATLQRVLSQPRPEGPCRG